MSELSMYIDELSQSSRSTRQKASVAIADIARKDPQSMVQYAPDLIDALNRPEAQTRWECLDALTALVPIDHKACADALEGAEIALFDENNGTLHLAAMRFLCKWGACSSKQSDKVWPLIDEGIQCYHGDLEFDDMLLAVIEFARGDISKEVKSALKDRMTFDAENMKGTIAKRAQIIISALS